MTLFEMVEDGDAHVLTESELAALEKDAAAWQRRALEAEAALVTLGARCERAERDRDEAGRMFLLREAGERARARATVRANGRLRALLSRLLAAAEQGEATTQELLAEVMNELRPVIGREAKRGA